MPLKPIDNKPVMRWVFHHDFWLYPRGTELSLAANDSLKLRLPNGKVRDVRGSVSPNRQWLLWAEAHDRDLGFASLTTGKTMLRRSVLPRAMRKSIPTAPNLYWSNGCWSRDSDHWIKVMELNDKLVFTKQSLTNPEEVSSGDLGSPVGAYHNWDGNFCDFLGADSTGRILATTSFSPGLANLFSFNAVEGKEKVASFAVRFRDALVPFSCALSSSGDALAWIAYHDVARLADRVPLRSIFVFVSDIRGNNLRALTSLDGTSKTGVRFGWGDEPHDLTWFDRDRHVSFDFRGTTWALPIS